MDADTKFQRTSAVIRTTTTCTVKLFKCKVSCIRMPVKYMLNCVKIISFRLSESLLIPLNLVLMMIF